MAYKPFSSAGEKQIIEAIEQAENTCSGEIRIHIDRFCKGDPLLKAKNLFHHLGMEETKQRNGVLIYVAVEDHRFAIVGDIGINEKVPENFWENTKDLMLNHFKNNALVEGIVEGVKNAGEQLKTHFPPVEDDKDELSNDLSYGA